MSERTTPESRQFCVGEIREFFAYPTHKKRKMLLKNQKNNISNKENSR